jgi:hypothetical protein
MEIMDAYEILRDIIRKYNKNPHGWRALAALDKQGYPTILISNPEEVWLIKLESQYKHHPMGVGMQIGEADEAAKIPKGKYPWGFRPLRSDMLEKILQSKSMQEVEQVLFQVLLTKPISLGKIKTPGLMEGPVAYTSSLSLVSKKQKELDVKLAKELKKLKKLVEKRYPFYT